jgi:hypothetical protein
MDLLARTRPQALLAHPFVGCRRRAALGRIVLVTWNRLRVTRTSPISEVICAPRPRAGVHRRDEPSPLTTWPLSTEKSSTLNAPMAGRRSPFGHPRFPANEWSIYGAQRVQPMAPVRNGARASPDRRGASDEGGVCDLGAADQYEHWPRRERLRLLATNQGTPGCASTTRTMIRSSPRPTKTANQKTPRVASGVSFQAMG